MKFTIPSSYFAFSASSYLGRSRLRRGHFLAGACLVVGAITSAAISPAIAQSDQTLPPIAQALPTPLPPLPSTTGGTPSVITGEQYLVLVNGSSDLLLAQIRQIEPEAFVNYVDGQSVIQAGRFSSFQNAQIRADELATFGIGAKIQATDYAGAPIAVTPSSDFDLSSVPSTVAVSEVPATAVAAAPSSIEFGQVAPFQTAIPSGNSVLPPPSPTTAFPESMSPPPLTTPVIENEAIPSGYYVVIPGSTADLSNIVNQVVALGAPRNLVRTRTAPRGPHVAVGPYDDHGIAQEWSNYLRDSGVGGARVHFE
ncbi:hypothetical protein PN498_05655 [Oscillatoria sp. CS-180]|uniref:hypothetical protein n=1 Tax=Oscillatoria sp. CS-180 TaxID=3021720 RepID=UPI00233101C3|nr:hypothetical protein [Oscillatoria sp. CS-180]MDB9525464.1 hypothetical protein [Oscillatoria sp. CS-180]